MPRGLVRYEQTGNFHFLTFSCYHRLQHLGTAAARDLFEDALERTRLRYKFAVAGYAVMPEHVHLLAGEPHQWSINEGPVAKAIFISCVRSGA
jgi:putative transposase